MKKVLIADADDESRCMLAAEIEKMGHTAVAVKEGRTVEELVELNPDFALLILDARLPDISGRELTLKLRQAPKLANLPIIIISPMVKLRDVDELLSLGASYFLPRPVNPESLRDIVNRITRRKRS